MLEVMMMKFTRKYLGDMVGVSGLDKGMRVGLDWRTWVSRRVQIQQYMVHWSGLVHTVVSDVQ